MDGFDQWQAEQGMPATRCEDGAEVVVATAPCDDCGVRVPVPDDHPVDYAYCAKCHESGKAWPVMA